MPTTINDPNKMAKITYEQYTHWHRSELTAKHTAEDSKLPSDTCYNWKSRFGSHPKTDIGHHTTLFIYLIANSPSTLGKDARTYSVNSLLELFLT